MKSNTAVRPVFAAIAFTIASVTPSGQGLISVRIEGLEVPSWRVLAVVVEGNGADPDTAELTLRAGSPIPAVGRGIDIAAIDGQIVFRGEILVTSTRRHDGEGAAIVIRAFDRLHRLNRDNHTRRFVNQADAEIVQQLASDAGLLTDVAGPEAFTRHDTAHQGTKPISNFCESAPRG